MCKTTCYRPGRQYLILGIVSTTLFLVMDVGSVYVAYWNIDGSFPHPKLFALIFGIYWSCWTLLGLWLIVASLRERLFVSADSITQHGCVAKRTIRVPDVIQINWKGTPQSGGILVRSSFTKIKINLANFTRDERDKLIQFFHDTFATIIQDGWSRFLESDSRAKPQGKPNSLRTATICASLLFACAGIFGYCGVIGLGVQWLIIGVINALAGTWYLWRIRSHRDRVETTKSA